MNITALSNEELEEQIELHNDRIETTSDYISDTEDRATKAAMQIVLQRYQTILESLKQEKQKRGGNQSNNIIDSLKSQILKGKHFSSFNYDHSESLAALKIKGYPYAMICLLLNDEITIAVGTDPQSPKDFFVENQNTSFIVDLNLAPRQLETREGKRLVYYAKKADILIDDENDNLDDENQENINLNFIFHSSDHLRYEKGIHVSGPHNGAPRAVKVENNIENSLGFTVTIFNTDGNQAQVQMAPKQMKIVDIDEEKIILKGFGQDLFGESFDDYGLSIIHNDGNILKCILHMFDRNIDIIYLA